jgi:hypothetical protein
MCLPITIRAATPLENHVEIKDGRHIITKTFEASPDEDPALLKETPFEQDGFSYAHFETAKEEVPLIETREEVRTATVTTSVDDVQSILAELEPEIDYIGDDGYVGKLLLDPASIKTEVEGYTTETYSITESATYMGLGSNDPSSIPKSTVKKGVTLALKNIDWTIQESQTVDYDVIPTKYTAVANYAGSYSKNVPTGYISTVEYSGEVRKTRIEKVIYTMTYIGTAMPEPTPIPTPTPEFQEKENLNIWTVEGVLLGLAVLGGAIAAFFIFFFNTYVYIKNCDEYRLITRKRIKWSNPAVDLSGLEVEGKEIAVNVKKRVAEKLFGRHITTVSGTDFSVRHLVDKQNCDFWYIVNVPEKENECCEENDDLLE